MFHHLNAPFKKGGSHGEGQDCGKQNHHARGDVDVEVKFSVQQVAGSDQDCADGEVDEDGDQGAVVGFYGGGFVFPVLISEMQGQKGVFIVDEQGK